MRWTRNFIPTLRESPQEAEIRSHRLMIRAGLIQKLAGGLYTFLPLGLRSLRKVEKIVREVMNNHGAIEVLLPILQPKEIWTQSGRWNVMRDLMLVAKDRQDRSFVLGPTHEEIITDLVSKRIKSYRDLPKNFYQIQTKFRDEIRPRFGLMRSREFLMKDGYSFDATDETAQKSYWNMVEAYQEIFKRCGFNFIMVEADTGVMGGSLSHEFMVLADTGEDELFVCKGCGYAANRELALRHCVPSFSSASSKYEEVQTPHMKSVEGVSRFLKVSPQQLIKTLIYEMDRKPHAILIRGDVEVNEGKLRRLFKGASVELASEEKVSQVTASPVGFAGPLGLKGIPLVADLSVKGLRDAVTGANKADTHFIHVDLERDCSIDAFQDLGFPKNGDLCGKCKAPFQVLRGIEVGHVFKLGTKYSAILGANYLNEQGTQLPCVMGCYGIGVSRCLAAFVEQNSTENGILWNQALAPFEVLISPLLMEVGEIVEAAEKLYNDLKLKGMDVLLDDRKERPGVKFKDADLIGFPIQVALGQKFLETRSLEVHIRPRQKVEHIPMDSIVSYLEGMIRSL
ncbi:MAG: proline--tRNA ligase [Chlamydiae bacterium]|nr:proline--tRNA ligase [Chlamydiota bacterium]MBI3277123.1 proline--tRNA ligase [Chlamydiota bacterium]